jgi:hypothetical protein
MLVARSLIVFFLLALYGVELSAAADVRDPRQVWSAGRGGMTLEFRGDYLGDFGLEIEHRGRELDARLKRQFELTEIEPLRIHAPRGRFESLLQSRGRLTVEAELVFRRGDRRLRIERLSIVPGQRSGHPQFVAVDDRGNRIFTLSHVHLRLRPEQSRMTVANADVQASDYLAEQLGFPELTGMPIALGWLDLALTIPPGAQLTGAPPGCDARPIWPQDGIHEADVSLIDMDTVAYQGTQSGTGLVKTAPSATLRNEGLADVPWVGQFDSIPQYDHTPADQHPFLAWNLYRIADGRIEMLATSGVKHAFFTININCDLDCGGGNILWPGCEDVYSSGNNDTATYQGPREEIVASLGLWDNCGSFFDPGCIGSQTQFAGQWLHRLLVDPDEFQQPGAEYFMDAWYVIQYDTDIWNGMGYRPVDPSPVDSGWVMNPGSFAQGPVIAEWVAEDEEEALADHDVIVVPSATPEAPYPDNMPQGHLRLLVRVTETQPGRYRYNYALQNYDFDRAMEGFRIALAEGATVHDTFFGDVDDEAGNDWSISVDDDRVRFDAPPGNPLTWFTLFNFEIETDAQPVSTRVSLDLGSDASQPDIEVTTIGPAESMDMIFGDRFRPLGR